MTGSKVEAARARWATAVFFVVDGVGFGVWAAHIPVFKDRLGLTPQALSEVLLALVVGSILSMPVAGQVIARFGSRRVIWASALLYVMAVAGLSRVGGLGLLIGIAAVFGAAKGALDVSINAQGVYVERRLEKLVVSSFQGFWSLGGLVGATVSSLALRHGLGTREDFAGTALLLGMGAVGAAPFLLQEEGVAQQAGSGWRAPDRGLLRLAAIAFLGLFAEGAMADWDGVYLKTSVGVSLSRAALGYAVFSTAMAAGRFAGDALIARFRSVAILRVAGLLLFGGVMFALTLNVWWAALVGFLFAGLGIANIVPVIWGIAGRNQTIGSGPALATVTTVGYFGFLAGPPLIGLVASGSTLRLALGIVALFGLAIAWWSRLAAIEA